MPHCTHRSPEALLKWGKVKYSLAGPPSKQAHVCLPTPCSVKVIGSVIFVANVGFAPLDVFAPIQSTAAIIYNEIQNKHPNEKSSSLRNSMCISLHYCAATCHSNHFNPSPPKTRLGFLNYTCCMALLHWIPKALAKPDIM